MREHSSLGIAVHKILRGEMGYTSGAQLALETWKEWVMAGRRVASECLTPEDGIWYALGPEEKRVGVGLDLSEVSTGELEDLAAAAKSRWSAREAGEQRVMVGRALSAAIRIRMECFKDPIPFRAWRLLWTVSPSRAMALVFSGGNEFPPYTDLGDRQYSHCIQINVNKVRARMKAAKGSEVLIWSADREGDPQAKGLLVDDPKDLRPLFLARDREARILATRLMASYKTKTRLTESR